MNQIVSKLAVITGASCGIGEAYAHAFGRLGYNLLLVGRRRSKLEAVAKSISDTQGVQVELMICDLSDTIQIDELSARIASEKDLSILVNNAGYAEDGEFHAIEYNKHEALLNVHINAPTKLSHAALPAMIARGTGTLINVCSIASFLPTPSSALYGPTKSYLKSFSETLALTYASKGIKVQALCPGFTMTEFHSRLGLDPKSFYQKRGLFKAFSSQAVVERSLEDLKDHVVISVTGFNYRFVLGLVRRLPFNWLYALMRQQEKLSRYKMPSKVVIEKNG